MHTPGAAPTCQNALPALARQHRLAAAECPLEPALPLVLLALPGARRRCKRGSGCTRDVGACCQGHRSSPAPCGAWVLRCLPRLLCVPCLTVQLLLGRSLWSGHGGWHAAQQHITKLHCSPRARPRCPAPIGAAPRGARGYGRCPGSVYPAVRVLDVLRKAREVAEGTAARQAATLAYNRAGGAEGGGQSVEHAHTAG